MKQLGILLQQILTQLAHIAGTVVQLDARIVSNQPVEQRLSGGHEHGTIIPEGVIQIEAEGTEDDLNESAEDVFRHVYRACPTLPSPFYASSTA
ncbi:MAG: hypothetical protein WBP44_03175 [Gammaproteobacteria bacterium]|jgi:hypothetical protein